MLALPPKAMLRSLSGLPIRVCIKAPGPDTILSCLTLWRNVVLCISTAKGVFWSRFVVFIRGMGEPLGEFLAVVAGWVELTFSV